MIIRTFAFTLLLAGAVFADDSDDTDGPARDAMTAERLGDLVQRIDPEAEALDTTWQFVVDELDALLVYDTGADRMRVIIPIVETAAIPPEQITRLMQANFDSALDARYAIAQDMLWGVFIHPLSSLTDEDFVLGVGQTVNIAKTFGTSYTSGMFTYGGGDSTAIERREFLDRLREDTI